MAGQQRLYRRVFDQITTLIESGEFNPGSRLPTERELAERFGVSRPTVREAIIALEATNRVSVKTGSGVYVLEQLGRGAIFNSEVSPFEVLEARVLLEGESAALAAKMITDDQLALLNEAFGELAKEDADTSFSSADADRKFHTIIANATHNRVLAKQIHDLWEIQESLDHIKRAHQAVCATEGAKRISEHKAILDAISRHDSRAARTAMRGHFSNMLETMHADMEQQAVEEARVKGSQMRERFSLGVFTTGE
ncbi:FadR/GntR family transcriptional regulator [Arenicella xantha]|uniref:GntR family transcriptional regulator n=1 Tax=Arenicella xantha TaxID=644221 RepID=A0A395JJR0_9GAMM|nr:FadR/GntR family transcriptional regulator [Arenicella xantha]RBP49132.1 GntR family transcriptional regulator [Arenicella xantha]